MADNNIQRLTPLALVAFNNNLGANLTPAYAVPNAQKAEMETATTSLSLYNAAVDTAESVYRAAVRDRDAARTRAADAAARIARTVYANPDVTPSMVAALGLSPRSTSRARIVPTTPNKLTVMQQSNETLRLEWGRAGNPRSVAFLVEAQSGTGDWTIVASTTATKIDLAGYAPGVPVSFRIVAAKNGLVSAPSNVATVYAVLPAPALRLAA